MTDKSPENLHALDAHTPEAKRKRKVEAKAVSAVASAMAGEVLAAATGKREEAKSHEDKTD